MVWYFHLSKSFPQFVMIHTVKGFSIVSEREIDVFLKFPCFLYNPLNVGNLISSFSNFSKPSLDQVQKNCIKKFLMIQITVMVWLVTEPDILECKVKWTLRSTVVDKASGYDEIPAELFKSLKDDAIKVFHSLCQQIWTTQQ